MQELEVQLAKARFARRHLSKMTGIGLATLLAAPICSAQDDETRRVRDQRAPNFWISSHRLVAAPFDDP